MKRIKLLLFLCMMTGAVFAQEDKVTFANGDVIVGEIKGMKQGVLSIETAYSDSDFTIDWEGIQAVESQTYFLITLSDGKRYNGKIASAGQGQINLTTEEEGTITVNVNDIVNMESIDKGFWSQVYANIDFGWDITKANNLHQASMRANLGYLAEKWSTDMYYNALSSNQDSVAPIRRNDAGIDFKYYFHGKWFGVYSTTFLSNTEQLIDLRTNGKIGLGTYILQTNAVYWNLSGGASFVMENYTNPDDDRDSWEGFIASELNMFDTGDLSLTSKIGLYPGITEKGRFRTDFSMDVKYDLPKDFYIRIGVTLNYDNKPVEGASESDYVFSSGFGWEL